MEVRKDIDDKIINDSEILSEMNEKIYVDLDTLLAEDKFLPEELRLLRKLYSEDYDFTDKELVKLSGYLFELKSSRVIDILLFLNFYNRKLISVNNFEHDFLDFYRTIIKKQTLNESLAFYGRLDALKWLYENGRLNNANQTFRSAANGGQLDVIVWLYPIKDINKDTLNISLLDASEKGYTEIVLLLIDLGAKHNMALPFASKNGHLDVVFYLLEAGFDVHVYDEMALILASKNGHYLIVQLLLQKGADPSIYNNEPLKTALMNGHEDIVSLLETYRI